jgi:hypothetical protein
MVHIISVVVQEHIRTHPEEAGSPTVSTLYTKDPQRKKLTKRYMGILVSFPVARLAPFAPPEQPPEGEKTKIQRTQIRRGSLADSQLYGPREWLAEDEAIHFAHIGRGEAPKPAPDSGSAAAARRRRWREADPPAIILTPSVNPADFQPPPPPSEGERWEQLLSSLTTSTTALEQTSSRRWSRKTKIRR